MTNKMTIARRIPESELIINSDGSAFHIHLRPEELADIVILVGDPGRVDMIGYYLSDVEFRHASREFVSITGRYNGKRLTVLSTGIGTDNCDIVMTELDALANVDFETREVKKNHRELTILRIGTTGAIQPDIPIGSPIFSHYSIGCDGLLNWYENRESIALQDFEDAFKEHVHWNKHLPDPYFVRAGQAIIDRFIDCTVKGMTISACSKTSSRSLSRGTRLPISRWKVRLWRVWLPSSGTMPVPCAAPSLTGISKMPTPIISLAWHSWFSWRWTV